MVHMNPNTIPSKGSRMLKDLIGDSCKRAERSRHMALTLLDLIGGPTSITVKRE